MAGSEEVSTQPRQEGCPPALSDAGGAGRRRRLPVATQRLLLRLWDGRLPGRAPWAHLPGQLPEGGLGPGAGSQELSHWVRGGWALRAGACVRAHPAPVVEATITLSSHAIYL